MSLKSRLWINHNERLEIVESLDILVSRFRYRRGFYVLRLGIGNCINRFAAMHQVDRSESPHQNALPESVGAGTIQQQESQGHKFSQPQPKLSSQAAAALQVGSKRKLPDSFRSHPPAESKQTKQKVSQDNVRPRHTVPATHRQPATRIAAQAHAVNKAAAHTLQKASNNTVLGQAVLNDTSVQLASQVKRRLPDSLVGSSKPGLKAHASGTKFGPTALSLKAGPSEHDTKVYSCPM